MYTPHCFTPYTPLSTHTNSCGDPTMLDTVGSMDLKLELIQKSLDQYLETKRMLFPRFYFVSDDDLLEILGQSRDPSAVKKHLKKCFEVCDICSVMMLVLVQCDHCQHVARAMHLAMAVILL
jgi:Dynein heavy chain, N-terminal region 2